MILGLLIFINIIFTITQCWLFTHQYLKKGYFAQIAVGLTGVIINVILAQKAGSFMLIYCALNVFFVHQATVGLHRIKLIGQKRMEKIRDRIEEKVEEENI